MLILPLRRCLPAGAAHEDTRTLLTDTMPCQPSDHEEVHRPLTEPFATIIDTIRRNNPEAGGEYRAAVAELQARLALAQDRSAQRLGMATWALVLVTVILVIVKVTR